MEKLKSINEQNKINLREALGNQKVTDFVEKFRKESYSANCLGHEEEIKAILEEAFRLLIQNKDDEEKFELAVKKITYQLFQKQNEDFWFNRIYRDYKTDIKPEKTFNLLKDRLNGKRILDIGSGGGYLALKLFKAGYEVLTTDVLDYRVKEAKMLPFKRMSGVQIPYPDKSADTVLLFDVLHHIAGEEQPSMLRELKRVATRAIIEEDVYDLPDEASFKEVIEKLELLKEFNSLEVKDQFQVLILLDYVSNALCQGLPQMNFPFNFRTVLEWQELFRKERFRIIEMKLLGFQEGHFNSSCHVLFVIKNEKK